jgi:predicted secreted protein
MRAQEGVEHDATSGRLLGHEQRTVLELSETARREVAEDELNATLYARAEAPEAGAAQGEVNRRMTDALAKARAAKEIRVGTGGYQVYREQPGENVWVWVASQELDLSAADGERLLALVADLQAMGLAVRELSWRVADATRRATERALLADALRAMDATARRAADHLGLSLSGWRRVTLVPTEPQRPRYGATSAPVGAEAGTPPVAAPGDTEVSVTVRGEALLEAGAR